MGAEKKPMTCPSCARKDAALRAVEKTLRRIAHWNDFPNVVDRHGELTPYGVAYGSNGERDFMRDLASKALAALAEAAPAAGETGSPGICPKCGEGLNNLGFLKERLSGGARGEDGPEEHSCFLGHAPHTGASHTGYQESPAAPDESLRLSTIGPAAQIKADMEVREQIAESQRKLRAMWHKPPAAPEPEREEE